MVPRGEVVAGPRGGVALSAGVAGAGQHERARVGLERQQAVPGGAGVLHAVDVVDLGVHRGAGDEARFVDAVDHVVGHGLRGIAEDGGLVHVVPEAGDAVGDELLVERAPPVARLLSA